MTRWGLVATIKAPLDQIQAFAAHHLELGAHRLYLYLDAPDPQAEAALRAHPKIRVKVCDDAFWQAAPINRPKKHQLRQTHNAGHAYARAGDVDWLLHIDVDEFLWPETPKADVAAHLDALPATCMAARVRPMELLSGSDALYKAFIPPGPDRHRIIARLYPTYGQFLKGGFLSHVAGKIFARTGQQDVTFKIHNVFHGDVMNPGGAELHPLRVCHNHAPNWDQWQSSYQFRLKQGSYRAELAPNRPHEKGGLNMHELFAMIEQDDPETGLRAFFEEVCQDNPRLRGALQAEGLLQHCDLDLDRKTRAHFP